MLQNKSDVKPDPLSDELLSQWSGFIAKRVGLHFPENRRRNLEKSILCVVKELGFEDAASCIRWLVSSPLPEHSMEILAAHLTVGETYFFREKGVFTLLREHILPERIHAHHGRSERLRIWSAGCSTGEEPYSIAILLDQMMSCFRSPPHSSKITIVATDLNARFLRKASEGLYGEWSFRGTSQEIKDKYFTRTKDGCYEILPAVRKGVTFFYLNLMEDAYPSPLNGIQKMDVIFCRNVLMYFEREEARKIVRRLHDSLADGGWLIISPSEMSHLFDPLFERVCFSQAVLYRKTSGDGNPETKGFGTERDFISENPEHHTFTRGVSPPSRLSLESRSEAAVSGRVQGKSVEREKAVKLGHALYREASALYEQGRYRETIEAITEYVAREGEELREARSKTTEMRLNKETLPSGEVISLLIQAYANEGRLAEALEWSEKAISENKLDPKMYYLQGNILQEQGRMEEAAASLKRALYIDSGWVPAHFALGHLMRKQGKGTESLKHFRIALSLLAALDKDHIVPELDGITARRLADIVRSMIADHA